ncbi:thioesterase family protein [Aeromicrobium sp.]|uniref:thioesterase family protein n=1 Tax=Aeromicrobium sp. TaxID=1871063 RepID=UPI0025BBABCB|nr:thioesterase family protein [Aeromicrobium sp.]MCK5890428.1 thioesterase family protein [Aeromicrobium sp.]
MSDFATYEQLAALDPTSTAVVGPEHLDLNGHMNISHYYTFGGRAMWSLNETTLGMPDGYIAERGMTTFTAEQHLRFLAESHAGDELAMVARAIDRGSRALHLASVVLNTTRGQIACVTETLVVHVDFSTRRPVPFPDDVAAKIDAALADSADLRLPISGALGIRR